MDSAAIAGRSGKAVWLTQILRWTTSAFTLRLTTGGVVVWGSEVFLQRDPTYGVLADLPPFEDGIDNQTTRVDLGFYPDGEAALAAMAGNEHQGSRIEVFDCAIDPDTGALWGEPDELFSGEVDFARFVIGERNELILECETEDALLNEPNEDRRLSDSAHRDIWPGELGMSHVTGVGRKIYWRQNPPSGMSGGGSYGVPGSGPGFGNSL
ncbi:hypothetical protein E4M02_02620 [Brevundimonas sp. S30B]|uniref:hypothetical protein n=1 Tax=unclassified Brevundimonas TaxID=2622653 RepID=UPI001071F523|nr:MULTISPECIES: hypothetical protein [unclassified Brevundimonas]QBX37216.1 hypothetical protein E4M01_05200 [Brevundimonas sp. MF30-B]TFW03990.1 hypothetical protein E4M02_02620 [Brevundimonas sp. S30B]